MVESVILGIGLNIKTDENQFPEELREIAGSLFPEGITRNQIAAEIINEIMNLSENLEDKSLIEEYKKYSLVLGKVISYNKNGESYTAKAIDINNQGNLVVENEQGETYVIQSGEVSIGSRQMLEALKHPY
jgi:BirA family biotin operon repressor/biotin-[acetyl-CoA-carboxylase] ligase